MVRAFAVLALVLSSLVAPSATHFSLVRSTPTADQAMTDAPKRVQIWFSETPAPGVSQIKLLGVDKAALAIGKTVVDKDKSIYAEVTSALAPGAYLVSWRAAGDDGHVLSGEIKFKITPKSGS